jgi:hypothetical protein
MNVLVVSTVVLVLKELWLVYHIVELEMRALREVCEIAVM